MVPPGPQMTTWSGLMTNRLGNLRELVTQLTCRALGAESLLGIVPRTIRLWVGFIRTIREQIHDWLVLNFIETVSG